MFALFILLLLAEDETVLSCLLPLPGREFVEVFALFILLLLADDETVLSCFLLP